MAKTIKFISSGSSSLLGNFAPGDIARNIPDDLADHLVQEAMCAQYLEPGQQSAPPVKAAAAPRTPRKKSNKATPGTGGTE